MGGGGLWKTPDWKVHTVEGCPAAKAHVEKLEKMGLKDPWVRNEVWRYVGGNKTPLSTVMRTILIRGAPIGIALFGLTVGMELALQAGVLSPPKKDD